MTDYYNTVCVSLCVHYYNSTKPYYYTRHHHSTILQGFVGGDFFDVKIFIMVN